LHTNEFLNPSTTTKEALKQGCFGYFLTQQWINQDVLPTLIKLIFPKYICSLKKLGKQ
jgi:hypothetical protein